LAGLSSELFSSYRIASGSLMFVGEGTAWFMASVQFGRSCGNRFGVHCFFF
jgi:hypothetical protein